jgi:DNA N-6-adenine-methyltransferase (Dam)
VSEGGLGISHGKAGDDWLTPPWLLDLLFPDGRFFDPCPRNPDGLRENDGLGAWPVDQPVFMNPPYSSPGPWVRKAAGHPGPVVLLVPNDPTTEWWQAYQSKFKITLIGQRLRFISGKLGHGKVTSARFSSAIWRKP